VAALREKLGIEAKLVKGSGGIFTVAVGDHIVAKKSLLGFPSEDAIVEAVRKEMVKG
jgi:hypothetical protein